MAQESTNYGLAIRWTAALAEMTPTLAIPSEERVALTKAWREKIVSMLKEVPQLDYFEDIHTDMSLICDSIVSFRIRKVEDPSKFYNKAELVKVFKAMTEDRSENFPNDQDISSRKCFIGQPVKINKDEGVLRIALGSDSLRQLQQDFDETLKTDGMIVEKLGFLAAHYNDLSK